MGKIYIVYGRSSSYSDPDLCYTWIEGAFISLEKAKNVFMSVFKQTREWLKIPEEDAEHPAFYGSHGSAYLNDGDVERWLELVEVEVE